MTSFVTKIQELKVIPQDQKLGLQNVVYAVKFTVTGTDGNYSHSVSAEIGIGQADPQSFTPLDNLTEQQVLQFIQNALAKDDMQVIQNEINEAIEQQKNPQSKPIVVPWNK